MVLLQYTTIEGYGAEEWLKMAEKEWHQPVICSVDDIQDAMRYMTERYWTHWADFTEPRGVPNVGDSS